MHHRLDAVTAGILFLAIKCTIGLRVSEEEELRGLDLDEHGIEGLPDFGPSAEGIFSASGPGGMSVSPSRAAMSANPSAPDS